MNRLKQVSFPSRILSRHVGGNTTYAREIAKGLALRGVEISQLGSSKRSGAHRPYGDMARSYGARPGLGFVLHYSADTGPLPRAHPRSLGGDRARCCEPLDHHGEIGPAGKDLANPGPTGHSFIGCGHHGLQIQCRRCFRGVRNRPGPDNDDSPTVSTLNISLSHGHFSDRLQHLDPRPMCSTSETLNPGKTWD